MSFWGHSFQALPCFAEPPPAPSGLSSPQWPPWGSWGQPGHGAVPKQSPARAGDPSSWLGEGSRAVPEQYTHTVPTSSSVPHGVLALIPAGFSLSACTGWGLFSKPTRSPRGSSWSCVCSVPGVLLVGEPAGTRRGNWASCLHTSASLVPVPCNSSGA